MVAARRELPAFNLEAKLLEFRAALHDSKELNDAEKVELLSRFDAEVLNPTLAHAFEFDTMSEPSVLGGGGAEATAAEQAWQLQQQELQLRQRQAEQTLRLVRSLRSKLSAPCSF